MALQVPTRHTAVPGVPGERFVYGPAVAPLATAFRTGPQMEAAAAAVDRKGPRYRYTYDLQ